MGPDPGHSLDFSTLAWQYRKDKLPVAAGLYPLAETKGLLTKLKTETGDEGKAKQVAKSTMTLTGMQVSPFPPSCLSGFPSLGSRESRAQNFQSLGSSGWSPPGTAQEQALQFIHASVSPFSTQAGYSGTRESSE